MFARQGLTGTIRLLASSSSSRTNNILPIRSSSAAQVVVGRLSLIGAIRNHGGPHVASDAPTVKITFLQPDEDKTPKVVEARVGESLLQTAHRNDIDLEGACEGVCACSTCHLILPEDLYDTLEEPSEDEEDMLDMAFGLTETSRLGCQITVRDDMDGIVLTMPGATRNFYVDGHVPTPH